MVRSENLATGFNSSVNSKRAHPPPPPGICHFVLEKLQMPQSGDGRLYKNPTVGLKNRVQTPHRGTTQRLPVFQ